MYLVLLANDNLLNETQFMRDCTAAIGSACDSIMTDSATIQSLIKVFQFSITIFYFHKNPFFVQGGDETSDSGLLMQYVIQTTDSIKQQLKLVKRRLPQDASIIKCGLSMKTINDLKQTNEQLGKSVAAISISAKLVLQMITLSEGEKTI